jgi:hypothetical protein
MKHVPGRNRDEAGRAENSQAEKSTNSDLPDEASQRDLTRERTFREVVDKINQKYAGVFRRLSK